MVSLLGDVANETFAIQSLPVFSMRINGLGSTNTLDSPEYLSKGDKYFVDAMYQSLLGRAFDPSGEQSLLDALGDDSSGNPTHPATLRHAQFINDFLFSEESLDRLVEGYYEVFLQRQADPGGLQGWVTELQDGLPFLTIGEEFLSSDEFYNKAAGNK